MPHKRAKRSVRERERAERVTDQAPSQATRNLCEEAIPKSVARVLDASRIRSEWKQPLGKRGRRDEESDAAVDSQRKSRKKAKTKASDAGVASDDPKAAPMRIQPGESLTHFNKRVEDCMRPLVKSAIHSSSAHVRRLAKMPNVVDERSRNTSNSSGPSSSTGKVKRPRNVTKSNSDTAQDRVEDQEPPTEFVKASTSVPKRVNDIVQAPPQIKHLPRNAKKIVATSGKGKKSEAVVSMAQKAMMETERENVIQRYRELKERRLKQTQSLLVPVHE